MPSVSNTLLAIAGNIENDDALVEEVARRGPASSVTVLIDRDSPDWALDESPTGNALRDRLARLLALMEQRTGAAVSGLVGDLRPLRGRWFDGIVDPGLAF
jgi:hypothetical protein